MKLSPSKLGTIYVKRFVGVGSRKIDNLWQRTQWMYFYHKIRFLMHISILKIVEQTSALNFDCPYGGEVRRESLPHLLDSKNRAFHRGLFWSTLRTFYGMMTAFNFGWENRERERRSKAVVGWEREGSFQLDWNFELRWKSILEQPELPANKYTSKRHIFLEMEHWRSNILLQRLVFTEAMTDDSSRRSIGEKDCISD